MEVKTSSEAQRRLLPTHERREVMIAEHCRAVFFKSVQLLQRAGCSRAAAGLKTQLQRWSVPIFLSLWERSQDLFFHQHWPPQMAQFHFIEGILQQFYKIILLFVRSSLRLNRVPQEPQMILYICFHNPDNVFRVISPTLLTGVSLWEI